MRILMLIESVSPDTEFRYALNLARGLVEEGHSVTVYTRDARIVDQILRNDGIALRHLPLTPLFTIDAARALAADLKIEATGSAIICQRLFTLIVAWLAKKWAKKSGARLFLTSHKMIKPHINPLTRIIYGSLEGLFFSSRAAATLFKKGWKKLPFSPSRIHVVHNSLYGVHAEPMAIPEKGPRIAIYNGKVRQGRGLEVLFEALKRLKGERIRLVITGRGNPDYIDSLRRLALELGIMDMITWKLNASPSECRGAIEASHFGVFPYSDEDAFGYCNIEIMAYGRPQITTSSSVASEYFGLSGGAVYVPSGNSEVLAQTMRTLATNATLCETLGAQSLRRYKETCSYSDFFTRTVKQLQRGL